MSRNSNEILELRSALLNVQEAVTEADTARPDASRIAALVNAAFLRTRVFPELTEITNQLDMVRKVTEAAAGVQGLGQAPGAPPLPAPGQPFQPLPLVPGGWGPGPGAMGPTMAMTPQGVTMSVITTTAPEAFRNPALQRVAATLRQVEQAIRAALSARQGGLSGCGCSRGLGQTQEDRTGRAVLLGVAVLGAVILGLLFAAAPKR